MESLEARHLLTGGLTLGADQSITLGAGAPQQLPINAVDQGGHTVSYSVSSTNSSISATLPQGNPDLVLNITHTSSGQAGDSTFSGTMVIELYQNLVPTTVAQIVNLANSGAYNGKLFYRIATTASSGLNVIQGGLQGGASTVQSIDDEFNPLLRFTTDGVIGMARSNHDTNSSEFFISGNAEPFLDFKYTAFGRVVSDPNGLRAKIQALPHNSSEQPLSNVTITSATVTQDNNDLALIISAPVGTTGSGDVTVTATDGFGGTATQTFHVTVQAETNDPVPFLSPITPPTTKVNTPVSFQLPTFNLHGDTLTFYNQTGLQSTYGLSPTQAVTSTVSVDSSTGSVTVTPPAGFVGVTPLFFGVSASSQPNSSFPDTQMVPLFVNPAAPTSITLASISDTGSNTGDGVTSRNNSSGGTALQFVVSGVTVGDTVTLFDGSQQIGSAVASSSTVTITTDGTHLLSNGVHQITAKQSLSQSYTIGNTTSTANLTSDATSSFALTVDNTAPTITSIPVTAVQVGKAYNYTVAATDTGSGGVTYSVVNGPTGFTVNSTTGVVTFTPTAGQLGHQSILLRATDLAGNTADQSFDLNVVNGTPVVGVSTSAAANSGFGVGQVVPITVTFASAVNVTGTPRLSLNNGGFADFVSGSGTTTLTFNYTVAAGQDVLPLDYSSISALSPNGGTIQDASSADAVLTLPGTGTDGLAVQHLSIDTVNPSVGVNTTTTNSHTPTVTGTVNDSAPSSGIAQVIVVVQGQTVTATVTGNTWSAVIPGTLVDGTYDVQATAIDKAGNQASTTATGALIINSIAPGVTNVSTTAAANSTFTNGQSLTITISFSSSVVVTGTPHLALNNGATATFFSGSGSSTLNFVYSVGPGQSVSPLDYASVTALTLNGGTIRDAASNDAILALPTIGLDGLAAKNITINSPAIVSDVQVTISPLSATTLPGGTIAYTITVTNLGPNAATGITLTDTLPAGVSFGSQAQISGSPVTLGNSGNTVNDTIASLAAGASATIRLVANVSMDAVGGTTVNNTVTVASASLDTNSQNNTATASVTVTASGVVLMTDPFDSTKMELVAVGTAGADNISFTAAAGGKVSVNMNRHLFGPFTVTSRIVAMGLAGNDVITVGPAIKLPAFLYAGLGIDQLTGGGGNTVLVGGGGADKLIGSSARNVIIAGAGASKLYSNKVGTPASAIGGSILIAGSTDFDKNDSALNAIMHEWGSNDAYATRTAKIRTGPLGGGVLLNSSTVHPTARVVDQLFSTGGWDWFVNPSMTSQMLGIDPKKKSLIQFN